jgi:alpha-amylase/alpha-mannosidase (GH57 family)
MHQPFYKDIVTGEYVLPWVRLHAIKDYYDMVAILDNHKQIKQTFNLVPSLLEQIEDYVVNKAKDNHLIVTIKDPGKLTQEDKVFMLQNFFTANWETMVNPYKRYFELLLKRGRFITLDEIKESAKRWTDQELLDLQVWFNLTWFGHIYKTHDQLIKGLIEKGRDFTAQEKSALIEKQMELMSKIISKYKELMDRGQIELTVTPYYHPILPLLIDTNAAKEAMPSIKLPQQRFRHPEDAEYQVNEAVQYMKKLFGQVPAGMWPSEGSVSQDLVPILCKAGIKWIATDEEVLSMSFGRGAGHGRALASHELSKPYSVQGHNCSINIIFRDHNLSDLLGFTYSKWDADDAVNDFIVHLHNIRASLPDDGKNYLVSIILDGENAWEYYKNNGWDFLSKLYEKLSNGRDIKTVRISDFLNKNPQPDKIHHLFSGSWINHNFRVWIGHDEDNKAWDYLSNARLALVNSKSTDPNAWKELYIAEGSDWCWWYGDDHSSGNDDMFDQLFRKHLKNIYHLIGKQYPQSLDVPIKQISAIRPTREPAGLVRPTLDGEVTNYYEWLSAGYYDIGKLKGAMHQAETILKGIYYGFDISSLHVRLDVNLDLTNSDAKEMSFALVFYHPYTCKVKTKYENNQFKMDIFKLVDDHWDHVKSVQTVGINNIVEMSVNFSDIGAKPKDEIHFIVTIEKDSQELERWPRGGSINLNVPEADYEEKQWSV